MTRDEVVSLMSSSKSDAEWNANCDKVKKACKGYPDFWFQSIVMSGLMDKTLGQGASDIKIVPLNDDASDMLDAEGEVITLSADDIIQLLLQK